MIALGIMTIPTAISAYLLLQVILGKAAEGWPTTKGNLEKFSLKKWTAYSKFPSIQGEAEQCVVGVKYSYEVGGAVYRSRRINFGLDKYYLSTQGLYRLPEEIENDELTKQLRSNEFTVRYWPLVPCVAVLIPGVMNKKKHYGTISFLMVTGILLSLLALM
jgi:hypothetical protein